MFNLEVKHGHKMRFLTYQTSQVASLLPAGARWTIENIKAKSYSRAYGQAGQVSLEKARHRLPPQSYTAQLFVFLLAML